MAAFEALGSFIATFADSSTTGLYLSKDGVLSIQPTNGMTVTGSMSVDDLYLISF